jgi:hypothetical protein
MTVLLAHCLTFQQHRLDHLVGAGEQVGSGSDCCAFSHARFLTLSISEALG